MAKRNGIVNPFLFPSLWSFHVLLGKSGRPTAIFPAHPLLPSAGAPCTSCRSEPRSSWPLCRSLCVPLHPLHISEITGQSLALKVLTSTSNFCPCWPCSNEYKHHCLKDSVGALHLLPVFVECRSFTRNHWFVLVSSKNELQNQ